MKKSKTLTHLLKGWFGKAALLTASIAASALLLEGSIRYYCDNISKSPICSFPNIEDKFGDRWRYIPGSIVFDFKVNSKGYLDKEFETKKHDDIKKIIALGDSFGNTMPYNFNYLTLAESSKWEIYNMNITGTNPTDYLETLVNEGLSYNPDAILVGFYEGNDFIFYEDKENKIKLYTPQLFNHFYTLFKIKFEEKSLNIDTSTDYNNSSDIDTIDKCILATERKKTKTEIKNYWQNQIASFLINQMDDTLSSFEYNWEILDKINKIAKNNNKDIIAVLIPSAYQVEKEVYETCINMEPKLLAHDINMDNLHTLLRLYYEDEGIPVIDLLPPLREGYKKYGKMYLENDIHWNCRANQIAGQEVKNFFEKYFAEHKN